LGRFQRRNFQFRPRYTLLCHRNGYAFRNPRYLNIGYPGRWGIGDHQVYITVAKGTKEECEQWRNEIVTGQHNLSCKGHLYPIKDYLNQINETLGKIATSIEAFSQKQ